MVFDLTEKASFEAIQVWIEEVEKNGPANVVVSIVGNKSDLSDKVEVKDWQVKQKAAKIRANVHYTSALEDTGISVKNMILRDRRPLWPQFDSFLLVFARFWG